MANFKIIKGAAEISKAIASIQTRGAKLRGDIHKAAVSCLDHIECHGDVTVLTALVKALPKGMNAKRLHAWAEAHGKVAWDDQAEDKATGTKGAFTYRRNSTTELDKAMEVHPFDFNKSDGPAEFDLDKRAMSLAKAAVGKGFDSKAIRAAVANAIVAAMKEAAESQKKAA